MKIKKVDEEDQKIINGWWKEHNLDGDAPPPCMLSPYGYMAIDDDGMPLSAAWYLPLRDAESCLMEWLIKNPRAPQAKVYKSFTLLCDTIEEQARRDGKKVIVMYLENINLKNFLKKRNFVDARPMTQCFKFLS